jgi:4-hydroxy-4-methyl-2-oxoglutarate aldolase
MLDDPPMLKVRKPVRRPTEKQIQAFAGANTSNVADCMDGRGAMHHSIKPLQINSSTFCGPALTCFAYPADNLAVMGALHLSEPGDVIVCANDAFETTAVIGDLVCGMMKNKGVVGFVTDGMVRDQKGIEPWLLPVFCRGVNPNSPAKTGPGSVGLPIHIGGITVETGDIIIGDIDGVAVVPSSRIDEVITKLESLTAAEAVVEARVKSGMAEPDYIEELMSSSKTLYVT